MALERNQEFLNAFGQKVRALRTGKGLSMRGMADAINVDVNHVSKVEEGKINTSILMAYAIAKVLDVPISDLFSFPIEP